MLLLDTDVMIDVLRRFPPALAWLASHDTEEVVLVGFVALELLQGCRDKIEQDRLVVSHRDFDVSHFCYHRLSQRNGQ